MRRTSSFALVAVVSALAPFALAAPPTAPAPRGTIVVEGRGTASYTPRTVRLSGTFSTDHAKAADAGTNAAKVEAAVKALTGGASVPRGRISVGSPVTEPRYERDANNNYVQKGFTTTQTVNVTTAAKDPSNSRGRLYDLFGVQGAAQVGAAAVVSPKMLENAQQRAEAAAVKNARARAARQASAAGRTVGAVKAIGGSDGDFSPRSFGAETAMRSFGAAPPSAPTQFDVSRQTIRQSRRVEFDLD